MLGTILGSIDGFSKGATVRTHDGTTDGDTLGINVRHTDGKNVGDIPALTSDTRMERTLETFTECLQRRCITRHGARSNAAKYSRDP